MMKRFMFIIMIGLFLALITACGSDKVSSKSTDSAGKEEGKKGAYLEASVKDGYYIKSEFDDETFSSDSSEMLVVEMDVTNNTEDKLTIMNSQHIKLIDGEDEIDANTILTYDLDLERDNDINPGETKELVVIFPVEVNKEYDIAFTQSAEEVDDPVTVPLDTKKYAESLEVLNDPAEALVAYVEEVYLDMDNEDFDKLVEANKDKLQHEAEEAFYGALNSTSIHGFPKEDSEEIYNMFRDKLAQKASIEASVRQNMNGEAIVDFTYDTLSLDNLRTLMSDYESEYHDSNEGFEPEKANEYARSKIDTIINSLEVVSSEWHIDLVEKDDKWNFDSESFKRDVVLSIFVEGREYGSY